MDWDTTVWATEHTGKDSPEAPGWQSLAEVKWRFEAGLEVSSQALNLKLTQSVISSQKQILSLTLYVVNIFFSDMPDTPTLTTLTPPTRMPPCL